MLLCAYSLYVSISSKIQLNSLFCSHPENTVIIRFETRETTEEWISQPIWGSMPAGNSHVFRGLMTCFVSSIQPCYCINSSMNLTKTLRRIDNTRSMSNTPLCVCRCMKSSTNRYHSVFHNISLYQFNVFYVIPS